MVTHYQGRKMLLFEVQAKFSAQYNIFFSQGANENQFNQQ